MRHGVHASVLLLLILWSDQLQSQTPDAARLRRLGQQEYQLGNYAAAESYFRAALDAHPDDLERAGILTDVGTLLIDEERLSAAEEAFTKALSIYKRQTDQTPITLVLRHLGAVYSIQRRHDEAISVLKKALKAASASPKAGPELISQILNSLGVAYFRQEQTRKAEQFFQQGLRTLTDAGISSEAYVAPLLNNLGTVYAKQNNLPRAEEFLVRSITLTEAELGPNHSALAYTLSVLGVVYTQMERYADAEAQYARAIAILEQDKLAFEVRIARALKGLANAYLKAGKQTAAEGALARAVVIARRNLTSHPDMADVLDAYSQLLVRAGKTEEANKLRSELRRARVITSNTVTAYTQP